MKITVEDFSFWYRDGKKALSDINLNIREGEFLFIAGHTGSGKSTLCYSLCGLIPHAIEGRFEGKIKINDSRVDKSKLSDLMKNIGIVFQNYENQIFSSSVELELAFGLENLKTPRELMKKRISNILSRLNIENLSGKNPARLSGGEKQLVVIASILALNPDVLILDEPTSDLDPWNKKRLFNIVSELDKTIIVVEHDLTYSYLADRQIWIENGRITEKNERSKIHRDSIKNSRKRDTKNNKKQKNESNKKIKAKNISYSDKDQKILSKISLDVKEGEFLGLIGKNGSGKTTLAKILSGIYEPDSGHILIDGKRIENFPRKDLVKKIGMVFQNPDNQIFCETVRKEIEYALRNLEFKESEVSKRADKALSDLNIEKFSDADPTSLSRGERQKVAIASIIAINPDTIILDEPTTGLDKKSQHSIMNILSELNNKGKNIVVVTHSIDLAIKFCSGLMLMENGKTLHRLEPDITLQNIFEKIEK